MFNNMDKLIGNIVTRLKESVLMLFSSDYINAHNATYGVTLRYAVLSEYFKAVYPKGMNSTTPPANHTVDEIFPLKTDYGDYLPYATCWASDLHTFNNCVSYWAGFFTSYPVLKQYTRTRGHIMRMADTLFVLGNAKPPYSGKIYI